MSTHTHHGDTPVREHFDALLLDLDGTLYRGAHAVPGAAAALDGSAQLLLYVTNNASQSADKVAAKLIALGFKATADTVLTSAQAAARLLRERLDPHSRVLVVGTADLEAEITAAGLHPVRHCRDHTPHAVVQGHSPHTAWPELAEAAYALAHGALWVATNTDASLPGERGLAPGNGAMVAALATATGREPLVAGKPYAPLVHAALDRAGTTRALLIGDRLDTDIDAAHSAGIPSLLVLTGVSTLEELVELPPHTRPSLVANSLAALDHPALSIPPNPHTPLLHQLTALLAAHPDRAIALDPDPDSSP